MKNLRPERPLVTPRKKGAPCGKKIPLHGARQKSKRTSAQCCAIVRGRVFVGAGDERQIDCHAIQITIRADSFTISPMPPYATHRAPCKTSCRECEILEERLNVVTESIVEILGKRFISEEEKSQQLDKALDARYHVLGSYLEHLDDHRPATAA